MAYFCYQCITGQKIGLLCKTVALVLPEHILHCLVIHNREVFLVLKTIRTVAGLIIALRGTVVSRGGKKPSLVEDRCSYAELSGMMMPRLRDCALPLTAAARQKAISDRRIGTRPFRK